ncbi:DUF5681 domain-containing protein [Maribellus sediminis]|uniref:DUF5681 domain-containing protein n=1 Tax=Maribellus sediminis TaxID=2696285 RepID=UPI003B84AEF6
MAFKKGHSGNSSGRPKGAKNRTTAELREFIQEILAGNFTNSHIKRDLDALSPKLRLQYFFKLLEFVLPKPSSTELEQENSRDGRAYWNSIMDRLRIDE